MKEMLATAETPKDERPTSDREATLAALRKRVSGRLGTFLRATMLASTIGYAEAARRSEARSRAAETEHIFDPLTTLVDLHRQYGERLPEMIVIQPEDFLEPFRRPRLEAERREPRAEMHGFEALGYRPETLRRYLAEGFPRVFTSRSSVRQIRYTSERIPMPPRYNIVGHEAGHCTLSPGEPASEIVLTIDAVDTDYHHPSFPLLERTLTHELAHAVDWLNAPTMDPRVRLELLSQITRRVQSSDRLRFPYVESIRNEQATQQLRDRATEYLAELVSSSFSMPGRQEEPHATPWQERLAEYLAERFNATPAAARADVRIVERLVRELDPEFDWDRASFVRGELLGQLSAERVDTLVMRQIENVDHPRLRSTLDALFHAEHEDLPNAFFAADMSPSAVANAYVDDASYEQAWQVVQDVSDQRKAELHRLRESLPAPVRPLLDQWGLVVDDAVEGRRYRWQHVDGGPLRNLLSSQSRQHTEINRMVDALSPEDRERFLEAAERYARIYASGEFRLSPSLAERLAEIEPVWRH